MLIHEQCGVLGLGVKGHRPEKMITGSMPDELADAVESVAVVWANVQPLDGDDVQQFVDFLRSDAHFSWDPGAHARRRLGEVCAS